MELLKDQPRETARLVSYFNLVLGESPASERGSMRMDNGEQVEVGEDIDIQGIIKTIAKASGLSYGTISDAMGMGHRYVAKTIEKGCDAQGSTIVRTCDATHKAKAPNPATLYIQIGGTMHRIVVKGKTAD